MRIRRLVVIDPVSFCLGCVDVGSMVESDGSILRRLKVLNRRFQVEASDWCCRFDSSDISLVVGSSVVAVDVGLTSDWQNPPSPVATVVSMLIYVELSDRRLCVSTSTYHRSEVDPRRNSWEYSPEGAPEGGEFPGEFRLGWSSVRVTSYDVYLYRCVVYYRRMVLDCDWLRMTSCCLSILLLLMLAFLTASYFLGVLENKGMILSETLSSKNMDSVCFLYFKGKRVEIRDGCVVLDQSSESGQKSIDSWTRRLCLICCANMFTLMSCCRFWKETKAVFRFNFYFFRITVLVSLIASSFCCAASSVFLV